jgi:hypothetical protein
MKTKKLDKRTRNFKQKLADKGILLTKKQSEFYKMAIKILLEDAEFYTLPYLVRYCKKFLKDKKFATCRTDKEICKRIIDQQKIYKNILKKLKVKK